MPPSTLPRMPMGVAADEATEPATPFLPPPLPMPPSSPAPMPPDAAQPPPMVPQGAMPPAMPPSPQGPPQPPYQVDVQSDGSMAAYIDDPSAPGGRRYIGVHKAFKIPTAFQPQQPTAGPQMPGMPPQGPIA